MNNGVCRYDNVNVEDIKFLNGYFACTLQILS